MTTKDKEEKEEVKCKHLLDKNKKFCVKCGMRVIGETFRVATQEEMEEFIIEDERRGDWLETMDYMIGRKPNLIDEVVLKEAEKLSAQLNKTPTPNDWIEKIAMNIVYQLDDDAKLSVEFRQANNDKRIDFVKGLIQSSLTQQKEAIEKERDEKWREKEEKLKFIIGDIYGYSPDGEIGTLCNKLLELLK